MKKMIACSVAFFAIMSFAGVHPALKSAIDNNEIGKAEILVKKMNIADIYCPATLSWKDAKKVYGDYFINNPSKLSELCDPEFVAAYNEIACSSKDEVNLCLEQLHKTPVSAWAPLLQKIKKSGINKTPKNVKNPFASPFHHLFGLLNSKIEKPFAFGDNEKDLLNEYKGVTGSESEFESVKTSMDNLTKSFSTDGDVPDYMILRACRLYPNIDMQYQKDIGYELFSCANTMDKYNVSCDASTEGLTLDVPTTLYDKDTTHYVCKSGSWNPLSEEDVKFGLCTEENQNARRSDASGYYVCSNGLWKNVSEIEFATFDKVCDAQSEDKLIQNMKINTGFICKYGTWRYVMFDANKKMVKSQKMGKYVWNVEHVDVNVPGSFCPVNNPAFCVKSGRLYSYEAATKVCPEGWKLPSENEWKDLNAYMVHRKKTTNKSAVFGKYPSQIRNASGADQESPAKAYFWSEATGNYRNVEALTQGNGIETYQRNSVQEPGWAFNVRCVKK